MRTNGKQPVVLLSLNRADKQTDIDLLKEAGVTSIEAGIGSFNGHVEQAYAIPVEQFTVKVRELLRSCNQRAVFFLDNQYNAWLATVEKDFTGYNTDDMAYRASFVGEFRECTEVHAKKQQGWSCFGGKYYVAGK